MPGLIGNLFTPDQDSSQSNDTDVSTDGGHGLDLSPSIEIGAGGSYDELDGSTTTWSNTTSIGLDVGATVDHAASLGLGDSSDAMG